MSVEHCADPSHQWCDPINDSPYLYRTQYLILSRTLLEAMPKEWQHRFVSLIDEVGDEFDFFSKDFIQPEYRVKAVDENGRYINDPWGIYRYPNVEYIEKIRRKH